MKDKVKQAIKNIETDLMYGDPFALDAVSREDVEVLLTYGKKRLAKSENRTDELAIGDKVKVLPDLPGARLKAGDIGTVDCFRTDTLNNFNTGVRFPDRMSVVYFNRTELEKVK